MKTTSKQHPDGNGWLTPLRICTIYVIVAATWILFSDRFVVLLYDEASPNILTRVQTFKGWFFVLVTAILLYFLINRRMVALTRGHQALRASEEKYRLLMAQASDGIFIADLGGNYIDVNLKACAMLGYTRDELLRMNVQQIVHQDSLLVEPLRFQDLEPGHTLLSERVLMRKDGTAVPVEISAKRLEDGRLQAIVRDISERKLAEKELRANRAKLAGIIESAMDAIITVDANQRIILFNDAAEKMFRYSADEVKGKLIDVLIPLRFRDKHRGHVQRFGLTNTSKRSMGQLGNLSGVRSNGQEFPIEASISQIEVNEQKLYTVILRDITERKRGETALRESEERYRRYFEENLTGDYVSGADGKLRSCNPAFVRLLDFSSPGEALNINASSLYATQADYQKLLGLLRNTGRVEYYETELRRKDGAPLHVIQNAIGKFDSFGVLEEIQGYLFDITERKKLEAQLLRAQKMEVIGQLANGVAHDFNNVMSVALSAVQMIQEATPDEKVRRYAHMIEKATLRGTAVAKQLLLFSRAETPKLTPLLLSQIVLEVRKLLDYSFPKSIGIEVNIRPGRDIIMGDSGQIHQVLLNLCINARDAITTKEGRDSSPAHILITLGTEAGESIRRIVGQTMNEEYVVLSVSDNGIGITEDVRRRMFDPFFTTKESSQGTGLGLSIVQGIVKGHGGFIHVESTLGIGSVFSVYFPAIQLIHSETMTEARAPASGGAETILVVEDEEDMRELLKDNLSNAGYTVIEARDGEEAIIIFQEMKSSINLVLSDMGLPHMSGERVIQEIQTINPSVMAILTTGYIEEDKKEQLLKSGIADIIHKPFTLYGVLQAIRKALDEKR